MAKEQKAWLALRKNIYKKWLVARMLGSLLSLPQWPGFYC
jgi:hypothetical protein